MFWIIGLRPAGPMFQTSTCWFVVDLRNTLPVILLPDTIWSDNDWAFTTWISLQVSFKRILDLINTFKYKIRCVISKLGELGIIWKKKLTTTWYQSPHKIVLGMCQICIIRLFHPTRWFATISRLCSSHSLTIYNLLYYGWWRVFFSSFQFLVGMRFFVFRVVPDH